MADATAPAGARDFDFLFGSWRIANERLTSRLTGSDDWERFDAVGTCRPILGGLGNVLDYRPARPGQEGAPGASLRLLNPTTGQWSIFAVNADAGQIRPPVVGRFTDGAGEFSGDDRHDGRPVLVRFRWSGITADAARWEQAFSPDRGATWETNWIMSFTRTQPA